jgi:hypothetical protein
MFKQWKRDATILVAALAAGLMFAGLSLGKPKPPPEPPPGGTIYFYDEADWPDTNVFSMDADGSNKTQALPPIDLNAVYQCDPEPSVDVYNGEPIWLSQKEDVTTGNPELFALRRKADGTLDKLQITDFQWDIIPDTQGHNSGPRWGCGLSETGGPLLDDFISFIGFVLEADGSATESVYRLNVSAAEIAAAMDVQGEGWPPLTEADAVPIVSHTYGSPWGPNYTGHDWSPDGSQLAYVLLEPIADSHGHTLVVHDVSSGESQDILGGEPSDGIDAPRWSPDGSQIAVRASFWVQVNPKRQAKLFGIWTVAPDGSGSTLVVEDPMDGYPGFPHWSPDGQFLVYPVITTGRGGSVTYFDIVRSRADGSGATVLTNDVDPLVRKSVLGWR